MQWTRLMVSAYGIQNSTARYEAAGLRIPTSARLVFEANVEPNCARSMEGDAPLSREVHTV
jgi:hypothetical protein